MFEPPEASEGAGAAGQSGNASSVDSGGDAATQPETQPTDSGAAQPSQNQTAPAEEPASNQTSGDAQPPPVQATLNSKEISYSSGAWKIYGTLYESKNKVPSRAIVLVPALGKTRDSFPVSFIERLHDQFPESIVVALDMRGHGKSTNLGTYDDFDAATFKDMKTDIVNLKKYVEPAYPNVESYYVVGASIGSTAALLAGAQEDKIHKVVMISPGMSYQGVDITRALDDYPHDLLAVSASGDSYSAQSAGTILSIRGKTHTTVKTFSGSAHGTDLFDSTSAQADSLSAEIVEFLK